MISQLSLHGISTEAIQISHNLPTSTVDITLSDDGQPDYLIHTNVAWDHITLTPEILKAAASARSFYFGSLVQRSEVTLNTLRQLLNALPPDCLRFFDINLRTPLPDPAIIRSGLSQTDILKLNNDELLIVASWFDFPTEEEDFARSLFSAFPVRLLLLTKGEEGAVVFERDREVPHRIRAPKVYPLVNTIGAGDAFSAGFLISLLEGTPPPKPQSSVRTRLHVYVNTTVPGCRPRHSPLVNHCRLCPLR